MLALTVLVLGAAGAMAVVGGPQLPGFPQLPVANPLVPAVANLPSPLPSSAASPLASASVVAVPRPSVVASPSPSAAPPIASGIVAVASQADHRVTFLDTATGKVSGSVDVGIAPLSMTLGPDGQTAWVFSGKPGESDFAQVDLIKAQSKGGKRLGDNPSAVAFSTNGQRAYVALAGGNDSPPPPNRIVFMDASNAAEFGRVEVGRQSPDIQIQRRLVALGVAPGPSGDVLYAAGRESGTVWALDGGSGAVLDEIEIGGGPMAILPDPPRQRVYVVADTINEVIAVDTTSQATVNRLTLPGRPGGAALAADGNLYIAGADNDEVWPVDTRAWQVGTPILVGNKPAGLAVSQDDSRLYVALPGDGALSVIDVARHRLSSTIPVGKDPVAVLLATGGMLTGATSSPASPAAVAKPSATPTLVPPPTPLPQGALPPEHLPAGAVSETFMPADWPVAIAFAPDGTLFYNELHTGKIRVVQNGVLLPDPFFQFKVSGEPEAGLIGLLLDPNFATNHYVYVYYTSVPPGQDNGGPNGPNELVRLTDVANTGTDLTPILPDLPSGQIHESGTLRFGPDGKLYVTIGDTDHLGTAQDLGTVAGKMLRVNPDGSIPADNPFVGQSGKEPAIWAYGLRNPWSFDFDPVSGHIFATDNGPGDNDELDMIVKGGNYGWPPNGYKYTPGIIDPVAAINPQIAPTGTTFYTGDQVPEWKNDWFYCNYHQSQLRRIRLAPESRDRIVFEEIVKNGCGLNVLTGPDGALYYTDSKGIYRIRSVDATYLLTRPVVQASTEPTPTPPPLPQGVREEDRDVDVGLVEWKLLSSRRRVPSGHLQIYAENTGTTQHALRIVGQGVDIRTDDIDPKESSLLTVDLAPGEYQLLCPIPGHAQQGMSTMLTVVGQ